MILVRICTSSGQLQAACEAWNGGMDPRPWHVGWKSGKTQWGGEWEDAFRHFCRSGRKVDFLKSSQCTISNVRYFSQVLFQGKPRPLPSRPGQPTGGKVKSFHQSQLFKVNKILTYESPAIAICPQGLRSWGLSWSQQTSRPTPMGVWRTGSGALAGADHPRV